MGRIMKIIGKSYSSVIDRIISFFAALNRHMFNNSPYIKDACWTTPEYHHHFVIVNGKEIDDRTWGLL